MMYFERKQNNILSTYITDVGLGKREDGLPKTQQTHPNPMNCLDPAGGITLNHVKIDMYK